MYERILVGTDGSKTATKAVDRAVEVAADTGASLTIFSAAKGAKGEQVVNAEQARHAGAGVPIDVKVVHTDAASGLIEEAREGHYDLVVIGNKGMTGLSRFLKPAVAGKVSHHLPCSLLIVKTS